MSLASRRFRSRKVPRFSPSGDDQIGEVRGGGVVATRLMLDWFDMVAVRLENIMTRSGSIIMTHEEGEPEGWLLLNGQQVSERIYPRLASIYGSIDGVVTLPDMTDRLAMGAGALVGLNAIAGQSEIILQLAQMPRHNHPVLDPGHLHAAVDRGHPHDLQIDSHTHDGTIADHTHDVTTSDHTHTYEAATGETVQSGTGAFVADRAGGQTLPAGGETITSTSPSDDGVTIDEAEINGTVSIGRADIRIHKAQSNIALGEVGDNASTNILNPVRGFNFLVKT